MLPHSALPKTLPNFLIIGAPRAGTTWISKNIREHPDIFIPRTKEVHFFNKQYDKGLSYYETFFDSVSDEKAIGEATPEYLYVGGMPERIHQHLPDAKLIVSLRNPVERVYSRYWNAKARYAGNKNLSFEQKIKSKPLFLEEGFYYDHLMRFYEYYPKDRILVLLFEDIKQDPVAFLRKIYDYLDVDPDFVSPQVDMRINAASAKGQLSKSRFLSVVYKGLVSINAVGPAKYLEKFNEGELPEMKPETREWLLNDVYLQKNKQLEKLLGVDLSLWNQ